MLTKDRLETATQPEESRFEAKKLQFLTTLLSYANGLEWISHQKTKEKIRAYLKSNFQYKAVARRFGVSLNSLQVSISYASKKLHGKIGASLLLLQQGDLEAAEREFLIAIDRRKPLDLYLDGFVENLPDAEEAPHVVRGFIFPLVHVEQCIQFCKPRRFRLQLLLLLEWSAHCKRATVHPTLSASRPAMRIHMLQHRRIEARPLLK